MNYDDITNITEEERAVRDLIDGLKTWQPIETAPKDGTRVLAYWPDIFDNDSAVQIESWFGPYNEELGKDTWQNCYEHARGSDGPTHWRPLSTPPEESQ